MESTSSPPLAHNDVAAAASSATLQQTNDHLQQAVSHLHRLVENVIDVQSVERCSQGFVKGDAMLLHTDQNVASIRTEVDQSASDLNDALGYTSLLRPTRQMLESVLNEVGESLETRDQCRPAHLPTLS